MNAITVGAQASAAETEFQQKMKERPAMRDLGIRRISAETPDMFASANDPEQGGPG
jgi:hypothetical protein